MLDLIYRTLVALTQIVWKVSRHDTQVRLWGLRKCVPQVNIVAPDNWKAWFVCGVESRSTDKHVELVRGSVLCNEAFFRDFGDLVEDDIALVACDRLKISVSG